MTWFTLHAKGKTGFLGVPPKLPNSTYLACPVNLVRVQPGGKYVVFSRRTLCRICIYQSQIIPFSFPVTAWLLLEVPPIFPQQCYLQFLSFFLFFKITLCMPLVAKEEEEEKQRRDPVGERLVVFMTPLKHRPDKKLKSILALFKLATPEALM